MASQCEIVIMKRRGGRKVCSITLPEEHGRILYNRMIKRYGLETLPPAGRWSKRNSGKTGHINYEHVICFRIIDQPKMSHLEARADEIFTKPKPLAAICG